MKLTFETKKNKQVVADFQGNPIDAVEAIVHSMGQHKLIANIIITAALTYEELKETLNEQVAKVEVKEHRINKN